MAARSSRPARAGTMKDDDLLELGIEHRSVKAEATALFAKASDLAKLIMGEIATRKSTVTTTKKNVVPGFAGRGVKIMVLTQVTVDYDVDKARARLKPAVLRKLVSPIITKEAVEAAVANGLITDDDVKAFKVVTPAASYPRTFGTLADK